VSGKPFDIVIRGGTIVATGEPYEVDKGIRDGAIAAIDVPREHERSDAREFIDAPGKFVLAGAIDCLVHFREPRHVHSQQPQTGYPEVRTKLRSWRRTGSICTFHRQEMD
jgi:dihydroorotase